jgi:hypothetical protein
MNGSFAPVDISLEDGQFITTNDVPVRSATIPPKTGATFVYGFTSTACTSRPPVRIKTTALPGGAIQAQISAGFGFVTRLEVGNAPNTLISVQGGEQRVSGSRSIEVPGGTGTAVVTLERASGGGGVFAPMNVIDFCGAWKTFVGRGG